MTPKTSLSLLTFVFFAPFAVSLFPVLKPSPVLAAVKPLPRLKQVAKYQKITKKYQSLSGIKILVNPGHGSKETSAAGHTRFLAKDAN